MTLATTTSGRIEGSRLGSGVHRFLGIPYAAPPVGALRWKTPQPVEGWKGVRPATEFGPIAPQPPGTAALIASRAPQSEDCLTLNVWTPSLEGRRPVMVWIHGGGFRQGASFSPLYDGEWLAGRGDVVVVTINYRLGALGFLAHPDLGGANWGLLDQIAALQWVRNNISAFGGDPAAVTIFGESAGAASVTLLLAAPRSHGLYQRAIAQSGAPFCVSATTGARTAERLVEAAGVGGVNDLRSVDATALIEAQRKIEGVGGEMVLLPAIDGDLFPERPLDLLRRGVAAGIPTIIGTNADEWKLWAPVDPRSRDLDEAGLRRRLERRLEGDVDEVIETFRSERASRGELANPNDLWFAIESELFFRVPAIRCAEALAAHEPRTWMYLFTWGSPAMKGWLGACHGLEIAFVFGTQGRSELAAFTGSGEEADRLARWMMDSWLSFARHGDPSTDELGEWPRYSPPERATLVIGRDHGITGSPRERERSVVDAHLRD